MSNPELFFDMEVGNQPVGKIVMELLVDLCPEKTSVERVNPYTKKALAYTVSFLFHVLG